MKIWKFRAVFEWKLPDHGIFFVFVLVLEILKVRLKHPGRENPQRWLQKSFFTFSRRPDSDLGDRENQRFRRRYTCIGSERAPKLPTECYFESSGRVKNSTRCGHLSKTLGFNSGDNFATGRKHGIWWNLIMIFLIFMKFEESLDLRIRRPRDAETCPCRGLTISRIFMKFLKNF